MWGNTSIFGMAAMIRSRRDGGEADTLWPRRNEMKTALLVSIACLIVSVQPCAAEWFADVYAGVSLTDKDDIKVVSTEAGHAKYRDVEFEKAPAYGLRFGRYFDAVPFLGLGVDYFSFTPNIGAQSVRVDGCPFVGTCVTNTKISFGSYDVSVQSLSLEIGRASCRESVQIRVVAGSIRVE